MGITLTTVSRHKTADQFKINATATFDSSYATGGEAFSASTLGLAYIEDVVVNDSKGYTFDPTVAAGGATCTIKAYYVDYTNTTTDGALIEVASTEDLSSVAPIITVYGK